MSAGLSRADFIQRLIASKLLSASDVDRFCGDDAADANQLARSLVSSQILTGFQIEVVRSGKFEELRIGSYDILDRLGAGGMGTVYKARHRRMKRIVALKVLSQALCQDESFVQRFLREVEVISKLTHPNIVMAHDAGEGELGHYLVMEYVPGQDLASIVQKQGPLTLPDAVSCGLQAARGLAYAHGQGIIHRDIKPANLLRDGDGTVKVTDLGLARMSTALSSVVRVGGETTAGSLTQAGGVLGTVDYMSPEQAVDSTTIDHRADMYSLGATLYFLLAGRAPYESLTMMSTLLKHRDAPIPSLRALRADVPVALDEAFRRMLAKTPAGRFPTMGHVVAALESIQPQLQATSPAAAVTASPVPDDAVTCRQSTEVRQSMEQTVVVPRSPGLERTPTIDLRPPSPESARRGAVLLIEPSRTQSAIIRSFLQAARVDRVVGAAAGKEALDAVRAEPFDAIICAMHLADMTGIELATRIRAEARGAPPGFVLISSESESAEAASLSNLGKAFVLHKPFTPDTPAQALGMVSARFNASQPGSDAQAVPAPTERGQLYVLIADDSVTARGHVRRTLESLGFAKFTEVADGAQAVAAATRDAFQLIVTDFNMPYLDGQGLVGYLRQNPATATVPIIMVTTEQDPAKLDAVRRLGVTGICAKQFDPEIVKQIIDPLFPR